MRLFCLMLIAISAICLLPKQVRSQTSGCNSRLDYAHVQANDPVMYQHFLDIDNFIAQYASGGGANGRIVNQNGLIVIPVVVHILHNGEAIGNGPNLSQARIQSQIDVVNEDFRRLNADRVNTPSVFANRAADINVEFRLACVDPGGNPTNGIVRKQTSRPVFSTPHPVRPDGSFTEGSGSIKNHPTAPLDGLQSDI